MKTIQNLYIEMYRFACFRISEKHFCFFEKLNGGKSEIWKPLET